MPTGPITIDREAYEALLAEIRRGSEICAKVADLRHALKGLAQAIETVVESCDDVERLRAEFVALDRRLREFDHERTPIRPPSRTDVHDAFAVSVEFAKKHR